MSKFKSDTMDIAVEAGRLAVLQIGKQNEVDAFNNMINRIKDNPLLKVQIHFHDVKSVSVPCEWVLPALEDQRDVLSVSVTCYEKAIKEYLEGQIDG